MDRTRDRSHLPWEPSKARGRLAHGFRSACGPASAGEALEASLLAATPTDRIWKRNVKRMPNPTATKPPAVLTSSGKKPDGPPAATSITGYRLRPSCAPASNPGHNSNNRSQKSSRRRPLQQAAPRPPRQRHRRSAELSRARAMAACPKPLRGSAVLAWPAPNASDDLDGDPGLVARIAGLDSSSEQRT